MDSNSTKTTIFQYINTVLISMMSIFAMLIFITINNVRTNQAAFSKEIVIIGTNQEFNTERIKSIDIRVKALELDYVNALKDWIDQNYVRKPQK